MKDNNQYPRPHLVYFPELGYEEIGFISVAEFEKSIPFEVARVFWTYGTPESIVRGRHAHFITEQVLIAITGRIIVTTLMPDEGTEVFVLDNPKTGVYIPPNSWHTMQYYDNPVQVVFASTVYNEKDYIRSFSSFKEIYGKQYKP